MFICMYCTSIFFQARNRTNVRFAAKIFGSIPTCTITGSRSTRTWRRTSASFVARSSLGSTRWPFIERFTQESEITSVKSAVWVSVQQFIFQTIGGFTLVRLIRILNRTLAYTHPYSLNNMYCTYYCICIISIVNTNLKLLCNLNVLNVF